MTIPAGAANHAVDSVTVTATSQANAQINDEVVLTTTCTAPPNRYFLPIVVR